MAESESRHAAIAHIDQRIERRFRRNSQYAIADSSTKPEHEQTNTGVDNISHAGRTGRDELVPSRYALRVGKIEVIVASDDVLPLPTTMLGPSA